jgi:hypothetical protein
MRESIKVSEDTIMSYPSYLFCLLCRSRVFHLGAVICSGKQFFRFELYLSIRFWHTGSKTHPRLDQYRSLPSNAFVSASFSYLHGASGQFTKVGPLKISTKWRSNTKGRGTFGSLQRPQNDNSCSLRLPGHHIYEMRLLCLHGLGTNSDVFKAQLG